MIAISMESQADMINSILFAFNNLQLVELRTHRTYECKYSINYHHLFILDQISSYESEQINICLNQPSCLYLAGCLLINLFMIE